MNTPNFTPIEKHDGILVKRDDTYEIAGVLGGKVRACKRLATQSDDGSRRAWPGLTTATGRASPQMQLVARLGAYLGLPVRCHCPSGSSSPEMVDAMAHGAELVQHKPGYTSVLCARAAEDAKALGYRYIPYGMEHPLAMRGTRNEVQSLIPYRKDIKRVVICLGGGMSAAGVLWGLNDIKLDVPVIGVQVGGDPVKRITKNAPAFWQQRMTIKKSPIPYDEGYECWLGKVQLDLHYESKCRVYLEPGDLFWVVGRRV